MIRDWRPAGFIPREARTRRFRRRGSNHAPLVTIKYRFVKPYFWGEKKDRRTITLFLGGEMLPRASGFDWNLHKLLWHNKLCLDK